MTENGDDDSTARVAISLAALVALLAASAGAASVAATETDAVTETNAVMGTNADALKLLSEDAFVVSVRESGDAEVGLVTAFDLTADAEKRAFRQYERNETKRRYLRQQFAENLRPVVAEVDNRTDRDMGISDPTVTVTTTENGTTGVVAVSVTWTSLAVERNGSLVVDEPFTSGFETDRAFVLRAPDGYAFAELTPTPTSRDGETVSWRGGTSLGGFEAVMELNATTDGTASGTSDEASHGTTVAEQSGSTPGFGVLGVIAAFVTSAVLALAARR